MGLLTFTPSVPSAIRISSTTPSSTASTSMVALSVSISAITSPDETVSPFFTCHLARVPSSMVGDSAGIRTWMGMGSGGRFEFDEDGGSPLGFPAGVALIDGLALEVHALALDALEFVHVDAPDVDDPQRPGVGL